MQLEIGYELTYEYFKESFGQGSWRKDFTPRTFLPWDGIGSPKELISRAHPEFGINLDDDSDRNHRIEVSCLRIGGENHGVVVPVEKQIFPITKQSN